jgi:hypothetical protein
MSPSEAAWFANARVTVKQGVALAELAKDFKRLATLESTSKLMLESWHQDQYESPGDLDYVGTNWGAWVRSGRVSKEQDEATRILNAINERFPSDVVAEAKEEP